jgi:hypothetical protein
MDDLTARLAGCGGFSIRRPQAALPSNHAKGCQAPGVDLSSGLLGKTLAKQTIDRLRSQDYAKWLQEASKRR